MTIAEKVWYGLGWAYVVAMAWAAIEVLRFLAA
jgi:hypothetical protein